MQEQPLGSQRIDRRLVGDPMHVHGFTVQPVAHVDGWRGLGAGDAGGGVGALVRVRPVEVVVGAADGNHFSLPIANPDQEALRGMAMAALAVGVIGLVLSTVIGWARRAM